MAKKIVKKWTIRVTEDSNGHIKMERANKGFSILELMGLSGRISHELHELMDKMTKVDEVKLNQKK